MDGPALLNFSPGYGAQSSSDGDGSVTSGPDGGFVFETVEPWLEAPADASILVIVGSQWVA